MAEERELGTNILPKSQQFPRVLTSRRPKVTGDRDRVQPTPTFVERRRL